MVPTPNRSPAQCLNLAVQFSRSTIGWGLAGVVIRTRTRRPSRDMSKVVVPMTERVGMVNRGRARPAEKLDPLVVTGTATSIRSRSLNTSSPSRQAGPVPPFTDTCHFAPVGGKGCTYTSIWPVSSDSYAMNRPSGENLGSCSLNGVRAIGIGAPLGATGSTQTSPRDCVRSMKYARNQPSRDQSVGTFCSSSVMSGCSGADVTRDLT